MSDNTIRKYLRPAALALAAGITLALIALVIFAPLQGAALPQGPPPPLTPPPVPTPTPVVLGVPAKVEATPTGNTGEVFVVWKPAQNATVHWVWSAKWDNTGGKWTPTPGEWDQAVVGGLENWEDHWFSVIAGLDRGNGEYEWSKWSNWAKAAPEWHPTPLPDPTAGIGDVDIHITHGSNGQEAVARTPCDGPTAPIVLTVHGGGSPTGASCIYGKDANFNLTPLVSSGHNFKIQMACIDPALADCASATGAYRANWDIGFVERVRRRTDGQVQFEVASFPELSIAGPDALRLVGNGVLSAAQIDPAYVSGDHPVMDISNLWGLYPDQAAHLAVIDAVQPAMAELTATNGGVQVAYMMTSNHYLFSRNEVHDDLNTWRGFRVGSHSANLSELLSGLGADPQLLASADVYAALEGRVIDGAISCATCGDDLRWYEVADYIVGPLFNVPHSWLAVNLEIWNAMPLDLQNIILEEGARHAYLNRHLVLLSVEPEAVDHTIGNGMRYAHFSYRIQDEMRLSAIKNVVPQWVERAGGPTSEAVRLFNTLVYPIVNVYVNPDGSASAGNQTTP